MFNDKFSKFCVPIKHPRNGSFWEAFGPLLSQIWPNIAEILTTGNALANKNTVWKFFERFEYLWKRVGPKVSTFGRTLTSLFLLKMAKIEKNKQQCGKTSAIELFKDVKMKSLSLLPFWEKYHHFQQYLGYFYQETGQGHKSRG